VKIGVLLPTFREGADDAFAFASDAELAGLDGVFAYDHLWPMGTPTRPALAPFALLGAIARRHENLVVGPLVARVGLVSTKHLVEQFQTLLTLAPGRVIAALGTGDKLSMAENIAYDVPALSAERRRELLGEAGEALSTALPVWFGGGADATNELARSLGVAINLWDASPTLVAEVGESGPVTWAGPVPDDLTATLNAVRDAGASWAVLGPQIDIARLKEWRDANELSKFS
jgi:alkanesulfonate monooxygenase SsuD/methylene tetrahydromethanopterin reductase-like flavin-dependent oxidoreductase (luciferase family)